MKPKKSDLLLHREATEKQLVPWFSLRREHQPEIGWIKTIRNALGMTTKQLGEKMGIAQPNVVAIEDREMKKTITLETLERAARVMDCQLVYALIPNREWVSAPMEPKIVPKPGYLVNSESVTMPLPSSDVGEDEWVALLQKNLRNPW